MADPHLIADVKGAEGCRLTAYRDTREFWTIGYGHLLDPEINWEGHTITQEEADRLLASDIDDAATHCGVLPELHVLDTPARRNAVIELVYNMGLKHWFGFRHTRAMLLQRNWQAARNGLLLSTWATEVGPARSQRLARYILTGQYA